MAFGHQTFTYKIHALCTKNSTLYVYESLGVKKNGIFEQYFGSGSTWIRIILVSRSGSTLNRTAGSGSAPKLKAGSGSESEKPVDMEAPNGAIEAHPEAVEPRRLTVKAWGIFRTIIADSHKICKAGEVYS